MLYEQVPWLEQFFGHERINGRNFHCWFGSVLFAFENESFVVVGFAESANEVFEADVKIKVSALTEVLFHICLFKLTTLVCNDERIIVGAVVVPERVTYLDTAGIDNVEIVEFIVISLAVTFDKSI